MGASRVWITERLGVAFVSQVLAGQHESIIHTQASVSFARRSKSVRRMDGARPPVDLFKEGVVEWF